MQDQGLHRCKVELCTIFCLTENRKFRTYWWRNANMMIPGLIALSTSNVHDPGEKQVKYSQPFNLFLPQPCSKWNANWEGGGNLLLLAACSSPLAGDVDSFVSFRVLDSKRWQHITDLNSFVNLSLVFRIGYGLGRPQVLLIESLVSICISTVGAKKGENGRAYRRSHLHPINEK